MSAVRHVDLSVGQWRAGEMMLTLEEDAGESEIYVRRHRIGDRWVVELVNGLACAHA